MKLFARIDKRRGIQRTRTHLGCHQGCAFHHLIALNGSCIPPWNHYDNAAREPRGLTSIHSHLYVAYISGKIQNKLMTKARIIALRSRKKTLANMGQLADKKI